MIRPEAGDFFRMDIDEAELDAEGRFRCQELPGGGTYLVEATNQLSYGFGPRQEEEAFKPFVLAGGLACRARAGCRPGDV